MTPALANARRQEAFTLLEIMLAVAIFATVLVAINGVFYGAMRLRSKTARLIEDSIPIQQTVAMIKRDLRGLVPPGTNFAGPLKSGVSSSTSSGSGSSSIGSGSSTSGSGSTGLGLTSAGPGVTELFTDTGVLTDLSPWGNIQKVAYVLRPPTNSTSAAGQDLFRLVTRNLLPPVQEEVEQQWLMGDVERLEFSFYNGTSWQTTWDSTTETAVLPKAIKVQIELAITDPALPPKSPVEIVVPIIVQVRTNQTQTASAAP